MSIINRFELYKIKRELKRSGREFTFYRRELNEFGEPVDEYSEILTITGIYHEHTAHMFDTYIIPTGEENGVYRTEKMPQIFCLTEDVLGAPDENGIRHYVLNVGDFVNFNGHMAKLTGLKDVMEWNIATDLSFEEVDYGSSSGVQKR